MWGWYQDGLVENVTKIDKANEMKLLEDNADIAEKKRSVNETEVEAKLHI